METKSKLGTTKRFLICACDESVVHWIPRAVMAESTADALQRYLRAVYSKDQAFRDAVLDLSVNMSFVERFYLFSDQEQKHFGDTGIAGTENEIVISRVKAYFAERQDLGERFLQYMDTENKSLIDDEIFEFIAINESEPNHGFVALDPESLEVAA